MVVRGRVSVIGRESVASEESVASVVMVVNVVCLIPRHSHRSHVFVNVLVPMVAVWLTSSLIRLVRPSCRPVPSRPCSLTCHRRVAYVCPVVSVSAQLQERPVVDRRRGRPEVVVVVIHPSWLIVVIVARVVNVIVPA